MLLFPLIFYSVKTILLASFTDLGSPIDQQVVPRLRLGVIDRPFLETVLLLSRLPYTQHATLVEATVTPSKARIWAASGTLPLQIDQLI